MARYIDAEKAVEDARLSYCKDCNSYNGVRCIACGLDDAMSYIEDTPTADVAEVVRCKDCKYYVAEYCTRDIKGRTNMFYMQPDDFCSYGERK